MGMGCTCYTKSHFRYELGVIAFIYMNIQAIVPPPNSVRPARIFTKGLTGNIAVITKASVSIPDSSNLFSHSVNSGIIGLSKFFVFSSLSIVSFIDPTNIDPKNKPSITNIIIIPIFLMPCYHPLSPTKRSIWHVVSLNNYLLVEGWNTLIQSFEIAHISSNLQISYAFNLKETQMLPRTQKTEVCFP